MTWNPVATIGRKRDGATLTADEISRFIAGFTDGAIPDYQMSALAMAIYLRGMDAGETATLTDCMLHSGITIDWPQGTLPVVDKHSTGGIGDKVSLVLAPLLACCGVCVPMISGRGLGPTGGTLDKLESIPGLRTDLSLDEIRHIAQTVGCVITGASSQIAPADKRLYALRDVTATVASIPLITASIMSKKLAEGLQALVLDVKWGNGAFMKGLDPARQLAHSMVATGRRLGVVTTALVTDMNQPVGRMAGNAVEVNETIETLSGRGPPDLVALTVALGAELLVSVGHSPSPAAAEREILRHLDSGGGREKLAAMVAAQGGSLERPRLVAPATEFCAPSSGWLARIDTEQLGWLIIELGGGRRRLSDRLDHSVGLEVLVRLGDRIDQHQPLVRVFALPDAAARIAPAVIGAFQISEQPAESPALIVERIAS